MTTAHRPTWYNAIGGENQGGNRKVSQTVKICSRDLPSHTKMKTRDLSDYVEDKTLIKNNLIKLENNNNKDIKSDKLLAIENIKKITNQEYTNPFPEDEDDEIDDDFKSNKKKGKKKKKKIEINNSNYSVSNQEKDTDNEKDEDDESDEEEDESEDEDDDEEKELLRELENLKREKLEKLKKEKEEQEIMKNKKNNVLTNNPLINLEDSSGDENVEKNVKKRKWTDEAIFRNTCEKKEKKISFINDTVRSAFHKKFLFKYIH